MTVLRRIPDHPPHSLVIELETLWTDSEEGPTREKWMQVAAEFDRANQMFSEIYRYLSLTKGVIMKVSSQKLTIAASDLSTSTTAPPAWHSKNNDVLTVASDTEWEFDYRDFWKIGKFVLSPGKGVYYLKVIPALDQEYPDILESETAVYAYGATQLQLVQWNAGASRWEAQTWGIGWTVSHWLAWPQGVFE